MGNADGSISTTWRSTQGDLTDEEWELISDLVPTYSGPGRIGRPTKWQKRDIVNAILSVAATGCQWRALPGCYPHWNTVHRYHVTWSEDGTWEQICARLHEMVREAEGPMVNPRPGSSMLGVFEEHPPLPALPGDTTQERRSRGERPSAWSTHSAS